MDMAIPEFTELDRLKGLLEEWARWMGSYRPNLGAKSPSYSQTTGSHDFESLFEGVESYIMRTVDTAVSDLSPAQSAAVHKRYLGIDWRFPRDNYALMLDAAHDALMVSLKRKNVIV